ncbi:MAG TPA: hypothetical protein VGM90_09335 [Kofleriaceae bacterium]|jgi:hypothetical protein
MDALPRVPRTAVLLAAVVAIAIAAYMPSLPGGWIYDDHTLIADNPHAHSLGEWPTWLTNDFWHGDAEMVGIPRSIRYWRPLISASYAVDWTIGGGSPMWFHFVNLLLHGVVAALAFSVMRRWTNSPYAGALAAALFAVHPTKAESVAWIAGRTDIICTIAILVAITGVARRLNQQRGGLALELAGTAAAYLSKEQAIVLPVFVLVEVWIHAARPALDLAFVKRAIRGLAPQIAFAIVYLVARAIWLPVRPAGSVSLPPLDHVLAVFESIGRYLVLLVAPVKLTIQQGLSYAPGGGPRVGLYVVLGVITIVGLAAAAWMCRKRWPVATLGIVVFGVTIAPTSNILYTGLLTLVSERFLYLPFIGLAWIAGDLAARSRQARFAVAAVIVLFAILSWHRSADYVDESAFWARELTLHPTSREARQYRFAAAMEESRYRAGLDELVAYIHVADPQAIDVELVARVAETAALLTPDAAVADLTAIDAFLVNVLDRKPTAHLVVAVAGVDVSFDPRSATIEKTFASRAYRLVVIRATIASRLGNQKEALDFVEAASKDCERCSSTLATEALVRARSGEFTTGLAVLDRGRGTAAERPLVAAREMIRDAATHHQRALAATGDASLWESAESLASLELWGKAYEMLTPAAMRFTGDAALRYAELAYRAGHTDEARTILEHTPGASPDEAIAAWAAAMGWQK